MYIDTIIKENNFGTKEDVLKLFTQLKEDYYEIFRDVNLNLNEYWWTHIGFNYANEKATISIIIDKYLDMSLDMYKKENTSFIEIFKNTNLKVTEMSLLHELGHYLDFLDNPELFAINAELDDLNYSTYCQKYPLLKHDTYFSSKIYRKQLTEQRADRYALQMAKALGRMK